MKAYQENKEEFLQLFNTRLIGIDEKGFALLNERVGNIIDKKEFEQGKVALSPNFWGIEDSITGKTVRFFLPNGLEPKQEHKIKIGYFGDRYINPATFSGGYTPELIVSQKYIKKLLGDTITELIYVTYQQPFDKKTEASTKSIFKNRKEVSNNSKLDQYLEMRAMEVQVKVLGNSLGFIIAFLTIMNYINMMAASIQNRSKEFATMESIGMTIKQIKNMLMLEGIGYAGISSFVSLGIGLPFGYIAFENLKTYQGITYAIPWFSNFIVFLMIHILCFLLPVIVYQKTQGRSIIERLKESENF